MLHFANISTFYIHSRPIPNAKAGHLPGPFLYIVLHSVHPSLTILFKCRSFLVLQIERYGF